VEELIMRKNSRWMTWFAMFLGGFATMLLADVDLGFIKWHLNVTMAEVINTSIVAGLTLILDSLYESE
jgi:hypothetical protein